MTWNPSRSEIESVRCLDAPTRYEYFVKRIADQQKLWSLWQDDGWALALSDTGRVQIPVWPHDEYCRLCASEQWRGYTPRSIDLDAWIDRWLPGISRDNRTVAVFPVPSGVGVVVEPERLAEDIRTELEKYY